MDINIWLTVVTIFFGALSILPKEERTLLKLKLHWVEYVSFAIILIFIIPFLILFEQFLQKFSWLEIFTTPDGLWSYNIAFILFFMLFLWLIVRLAIVRPIGRINTRIVAYFKDLLSELPFPQFYSIFIRYAPPRLYKRSWNLYRQIIFSREFLKGIAHYQPAFLNRIWGVIDNKKDFKKVFQPLLQNSDSAYYHEIKDNDGRDDINDASPFLESVLITHLKRNLKNELLSVVSDHVKQHLLREGQTEMSFYHLPPTNYRSDGEKGYDLPAYYHVRFISLLYGTAIQNKVNTAPHKHLIYSEIIDSIISNMSREDAEKAGENPTNYHWLISQIFENAERWMEILSEESFEDDADDIEPKPVYRYFEKTSTYIDFIPSILNFCCLSLYKGLEQEKISIEFVSRKIHHSIFYHYFRHNFIEELRAALEENVFRGFNKEYLPAILQFTLDEHFAMNYGSFREKRFSGNEREKQLLLRLWNYLDQFDLL